MHLLSDQSKKNIYDITGLTVEEIIDMDFDDIDNSIGKKVKHKITNFVLNDKLAARGQVYAETNRFITTEEVDRKLKKDDKRKSRFARKTI